MTRTRIRLRLKHPLPEGAIIEAVMPGRCEHEWRIARDNGFTSRERECSKCGRRERKMYGVWTKIKPGKGEPSR